MGIDFEPVKYDGKVLVGRDGVGAGGSASLLNWSEDGVVSFSAAQVGASGGIGANGAGIGVEARALRTELETENFKFGANLSVDTGLKVTRNGVRAEVLGFGWRVNSKGVTVKCPIGDVTFKI